MPPEFTHATNVWWREYLELMRFTKNPNYIETKKKVAEEARKELREIEARERAARKEEEEREIERRRRKRRSY